ncbi:Piso0_002699 [Millerozyma farinosa CBS 7064]|uniref:3-hydroxyanthranilate 3,4-dioxygenase n=1 Tax=Pichia sorbitophila (strain ATCC MYA-4447 / BCRC 22081 / CBS 7064 / NBRC 10061 / NRRL Y-12695) TaxID=559304 RepID=G8YFQ9_PICSO|nr:Piso0_002699 [Millerozyma farinosa CBS 7064]
MLPAPINIKKWIAENEGLLKPPVNNYCLHRGGFTIMIVGGPNERTDYHINQTPEYFHQLKGHMCLKVFDEGSPRDIIIEEGDSFLLPGNVPHNPVRFANTIGLVVEQDRPEGVKDKIRWYCRNCSEINHEIEFYCSDLGTQVKSAIESYDADQEARTCKACNTLNYSRPQAQAA